MKRIFRIIISLVTFTFGLTAGQEYIFFSDSPTNNYYDPSYLYQNPPSYLERYNNDTKFPVSSSEYFSGTNSLKLHWISQTGGDWGAAVAAPDWPGMDVNLKDTISFMAYSDSEIDSIDLPKIYLEDLSNTKTPKFLLADYSGNIHANTWGNIKIPLTIFKNNPGSADLTKIKTIYFGQSAADNIEHTLYLDDIKMTGNSALDSILSGKTNEELVLTYLKSIQDNFSNDKLLVPAQEDNSGQTFNNALTAMAFILEGEKERAERILDFYADRVDQSNMDLNKQNFYYNNEARGFYQNIRLKSEGTGKPVYSAFLCDRWMGDNTWLLFAYKLYEKKYGLENKTSYSDVIGLIKNLMLEYYYRRSQWTWRIC